MSSCWKKDLNWSSNITTKTNFLRLESAIPAVTEFFKCDTLTFHSACATGGPSSSCEMIILRNKKNKSHGEIIRVCMGIYTTALRNNKISQILNKNTSPYFHSALLVIWPLTMLKRIRFSELSISRSTRYIREDLLLCKVGNLEIGNYQKWVFLHSHTNLSFLHDSYFARWSSHSWSLGRLSLRWKKTTGWRSLLFIISDVEIFSSGRWELLLIQKKP